MRAQNNMSRRAFVKGAASFAVLASAGGLLSACSAAGGEGSSASDAAASSAQDAASSSSAAAAAGASTLVAYYSATGHTEAVAQMIADKLGADLFAIEPADPYAEADLDYQDADSRVSREHDNYERIIDLVQSTPEGFEGYQTVFIGYPIWWGENSWVVNSFAIDNDFTGKKVVPFCTSASSPIGTTGEDLAAMAGTGDWAEGRRFAAGASADEVSSWVDELGV